MPEQGVAAAQFSVQALFFRGAREDFDPPFAAVFFFAAIGGTGCSGSVGVRRASRANHHTRSAPTPLDAAATICLRSSGSFAAAMTRRRISGLLAAALSAFRMSFGSILANQTKAVEIGNPRLLVRL